MTHKRIRRADDYDGSYSETGYVLYDEQDDESTYYDNPISVLIDRVTGKVRVNLGRGLDAQTTYFDDIQSFDVFIEMLQKTRREIPEQY